jgi:hypothetical protein
MAGANETETKNDDEGSDSGNDDEENDDETDDDGTNDDGTNDDGTNDDGTNDDGTNDDGTNDDGTNDDGTNDDGKNDDGTNDDGTNDDGTNDDGTNDDGTNDDGTNDDGTNDDGTNENETNDNDETNGDEENNGNSTNTTDDQPTKPKPSKGKSKSSTTPAPKATAPTPISTVPTSISRVPASTLPAPTTSVAHIPIGPPARRTHISVDGGGDYVMAEPEHEMAMHPHGSIPCQYIVHLIYCYLFNLGIDISNLPVPQDQPPPNGSSRSWGATSRGRSHGNVHNIGDNPGQPDIHDPLPRGRVNLSIVNQRPTTLTIDNASSVIKVTTSCYRSASPLLQQISRSYSPVRSKSLYMFQVQI